VTRMAAALFGQPVTVIDTKARKELGYTARMSVDTGLKDLEARHRA